MNKDWEKDYENLVDTFDKPVLRGAYELRIHDFIAKQRTQLLKEVREIVQDELFFEEYKPKEGYFVDNASKAGQKAGIHTTVRKILKKLKELEGKE